jgi:signal peptidase II
MATRWFVLLSLILAGADQLTKYVARVGLQSGVSYPVIPDFFRLSLNFNKGIAWGMLPEWSEYFTYFAIIMVLVILMILRKLDRDEVWLKIALAFQMAGAIGNMSDRLIRHQVTDFIDVTLFPHTSWHYSLDILNFHRQFSLPYDWPIFNLADSFVVVGTVVLVIVLLLTRETPPTPEPAALMPIRAGLGAADGISWSDGPVSVGNIPVEEALIELSSGDDSEMLVPLEEVESVREEKLGEPPHVGAEAEQSVQPADRDKLDELSRRPEQ